MKIAFPRTLLIASALGLVAVAGASYSHPTWPEQLGLDFWNVPELQSRLARERILHAEMEVETAITRRRMAVKEELAGAVVAGRLGLLEAAARFRALNGDRPEYLLTIRTSFPGATDDERYCRNVIGYVESYTKSDPLAREAARRLTVELEHRLTNGGVRLPDVRADVDATPGEGR